MSDNLLLFMAQPNGINPDLLHDEIQAALGAKYVSVDTGFTQRDMLKTFGKDLPADILQLPSDATVLLVRATSDATPDDAQRVETLVAQHDGTKLSQYQQKIAARQAAYARVKALDIKGELAGKTQAQVIARLLDILNDMARVMVNPDD